MKICLGQINTTPGDFAGNLQAMLSGIDEASQNACDVVLFPELSIPGYLSQDLIYHARYIDRNLAVLEEIVAYSANCYPDLHIVVGYLDRNPSVGKPFLNMAAVVRHGKIVGRYAKRLLPFYDVFDELRYFEPGTELLTLEIKGQKVGVTICEDLWNDKGSDDYNYSDNPFEQYRQLGIEVVLSLNSSPYVQGKPWRRLEVIGPGTIDGPTVVYVNQYGGQDELVFDGQSFVIKQGKLLHLASDIQNDSFEIVDLQSAIPVKPNREEILGRTASLYDLLVLCLRDYVKKTGFETLVLASSGGVDSAVVCQMACDAVGPENVHAIRLPSVFSSDHSRNDAVELHKNLGCWDYEIGIEHESMVSFLNNGFADNKGRDNLVVKKLEDGYAAVADENIQARMRDLYVMHFSNAFGAMPLSTGNKTESACGYYTHFDMNFSFAPIKDLYKFQVVEIAQAHPAIPANIWRKAPSAELAEGQTDEASLLPYSILDAIVAAYIEDYVSSFAEFTKWAVRDGSNFSMNPEQLISWLELDDSLAEFNRVIALIGRMEFKRRQTCPGTKVSRVAFGIGRRTPIVQKWSSS
ncbi:MAG: NAD+ synthase (glutamine-hydrolyzing) [Candidatus Azotimanducaceae bacterium]|jgi:NAD+ synthase (glutamine-hydrolysing)